MSSVGCGRGIWTSWPRVFRSCGRRTVPGAEEHGAGRVDGTVVSRPDLLGGPDGVYRLSELRELVPDLAKGPGAGGKPGVNRLFRADAESGTGPFRGLAVCSGRRCGGAGRAQGKGPGPEKRETDGETDLDGGASGGNGGGRTETPRAKDGKSAGLPAGKFEKTAGISYICNGIPSV